MSFTAGIKDEAFSRCRGRCECRRTEHSHRGGRCDRSVTRHTAQYHPIAEGETVNRDTAQNCRVLCPHCQVRAG